MRRTAFLGLLLLTGSLVQADEWPQWMGPKRDNVWREAGLVETLPRKPRSPGGLPSRAATAARSRRRQGLCDRLCDQDNVKVDNFDRKSSTGIERVICLDEKTGKELWKQEHEETYAISYPAGPRSTPLVHGGKVYLQGAEGYLACLDANSGEPVWAKSLKEEYKTKAALWGYASQPLIRWRQPDRLAGGSGSHCVALNKNTGEEVWRTGTATEQGYSPPVIIEIAGARQLILCSRTRSTRRSQDWASSTGPRSTGGQRVDHHDPIVHGNHLFIAGYNNRNMMLELATDKPGAKTLWRDES